MRMEKRTYQAPDFEMERFAMDAMEESGEVELPPDYNSVESQDPSNQIGG